VFWRPAGHYSIGVVIGVAAAAAIIGDSLGYWLIGRVGGRNRPRFAESAALTLSSR
jgi:membrane protein DedA with SNARE-associated domain